MILREAGTHGKTCDELEWLLDLSHQTCSARCSELLKEERAFRKIAGDTYERRKTRTGRTAAVLVHRAYAR
jgi:hypothetical protein